LRLAHIADVHLGHALMNLKPREEAVMETFRRLMREVRECSVDAVLIAGDLFDHARPKTEALDLAVRELSRLREDGVEVLAVSGNHEVRRREGAVSPLRVLERTGLLRHLYYSPGERTHEHRLEADGTVVCVHGLQYLPKRDFINESPRIRRTFRPDPGADANIALMHVALPNTIPTESEVVEEAYLPEGYDYYALGHVHTPGLELTLHGSPACYPGSPEPITFTEARGDRRGFYLLEAGRDGAVEYEFVEIEWSRGLSTVEVSGEDWREKLEREVRRVRRRTRYGGPVVKIVATSVDASPEEIERTAERAGAERCLVDVREEAGEESTEEEPSEALTEDEILRRALRRARRATLRDSGVDDDLVLDLMRRVLRVVREGEELDLGELIREFEEEIVGEEAEEAEGEESVGVEEEAEESEKEVEEGEAKKERTEGRSGDRRGRSRRAGPRPARPAGQSSLDQFM